MADFHAAAQAIITALRSASSPWVNGHEVIDGGPTSTPASVYFCFYDQTAQPLRRKYHGGVTQLRFDFQISCVARETKGVRRAAQLARDTLWGLVVAVNASPIVEEGSNPIIPSGEGNDVRLTAPLTMHCWLPA